jgi:protein O-mannosyl-transferase
MPGAWRRAWREHPALGGALVVAAVLLASAAGLDNGFAYDDLVVIADNKRVSALQAPWTYFAQSYWGPFRGDDLYRPLTVLGFALQWAWGDGAPLTFHVTSVVLYAGTALAVLALARELLRPAAALLAALAFAVHPVHVEAVGNVVGQAELLTALFLLLAVTAYVRARRRGALRAGTALLITGLYAAALLVKEHAIVLPGLLLAAEVALTPSLLRPRGSDDVRRLRVFGLLLVLVAVAYLTARITVTGDLVGDAPHPGLERLGPGARSWVMIALVPEVVRLMLWPARLYADYSPQLVAIRPEPSAAHLPGLLLLAGWAALLALGWRRWRVGAFLALWLPVTLLLVSNVIAPTGVLLAERTLFLPSVAVAMGLGALAGRLWDAASASDGEGSAPDRRAIALGRVTCGVLLALGAWRSADRQSAWEDNAAVISTMLADAPRLFRGHLLLGETYAVNNEFARAEPPLRRAVELYPGFSVAQIDFARVLQLLGRCEEALPHFDAGLRLDPRSQVGQVNRAICLLHTRQLHAARVRALEGLAGGVSASAFRSIRWTADSMLLAADSADSRNLFARSGRPFARGAGRPDIRFTYVLPSAVGTSGNMQDSVLSGAEGRPK